MSWTLCTSGAAIVKAGAYANSDIQTSGAILAAWSDEAEGRICAECHTDFVTNPPSEAVISGALQDVCSAMIAKKMIAYDMTGYTSTREAESMLDILDDDVNKGLIILKDKKKQRTST